MQKINFSLEDVSNKSTGIQKRKRINRIKTAIIIIIFILFLIPTILCILLSIQVNKLEKKINSLMTQNIESGYKNQDGTGNYAYASEIPDYEDEKSEANGSENMTDENKNGSTSQKSGIHNASQGKIGGLDTSDLNKSSSDRTDLDSFENVKTDKTDLSNSASKQSGSSEKTYNSDNASANTKEENASGIANKDAGTTATGENAKDSSNRNDSKDVRKKDKKSDEPENTSDKDNKEKDFKDIRQDVDTSKESRGIYHEKKVYLTFDDGPSDNTDKILDILADYNVKATFFVIGSTDEEDLKRYKRIVDEGHTLGMHSYSHNYKEIYKSLEDFDKDFTKLWKLLYDTTGYMPTLYRFPGGSLNQVCKEDIREFIGYLNKKGITYYDWNVVNGDAEGKDYTEGQMIENVLNGVAKKEVSIVLMHDGTGKDKTVDTLPKILDALISGGAQVLPLDENVPLIQQVKASSVK